jgi:hypothetical protein
MKNNFRFIFPRLIGATLIVGIATLILATIFKLMIGLVLIGGVVALIKRATGSRNHQLTRSHYGQFSNGGFEPYAQNQWSGPVPVNREAEHVTIVPIN